MALSIGASADRVLRVHVFAKYLSCSSRTVRRLIQNHEIDAVRIGRRAWGIRFSELNRIRRGKGGRYVGD